MSEPAQKSSPVSVVWNVARILLLGSLVGGLMFAGYLALAVFGV